jgi:hypothetical protein
MVTISTSLANYVIYLRNVDILLTSVLVFCVRILLNNNNTENAEALLDASKEIGLEVNSEKTKHMIMSRHQTAGQSNYIRVANKSFEKVGTSSIWEQH